ncbi:MAG: polysaccharide biosynthesis transport protein [Candidatus Sumerlaeota bacterium]|nr:polysaccharide biosynthesis transport protein [Candidatus Sumerlaeota bacterium]
MTGYSRQNRDEPEDAGPFPRGPLRGASSTADEQEDNEFLRYLGMIWERKWLVFFCVAAFLLFTAVQLRRATNIYVATATIKYEPSSTRYLDFGEVGRTVNAVDEIRTQVEIIRGPQITMNVIRSLGMDRAAEKQSAQPDPVETANNIDIVGEIARLVNKAKREVREYLVPTRPVEPDPEQRRRQNMIAWLRDRVTVRQYQDTKLIDIIVRDSDAERAARIADAYAEQYMRSLNLQKSNSYQTVRSFFDDQIQQARTDLMQANQALLDYSDTLDTDLQLMEQESGLTLEMTRSLRQQIEMLKNELALIDAQGNVDDSMAIKAHLLAQNKIYNDLLNRIADLELQRVALIAENTEDNPDIVRLDRQLASLKEQLASHVSRFELEQAGQLILTRERLKALQDRLNEQEERFNRLQNQLIGYKPLRMNVDVQQQLYDQLLGRAKEIGVASEINPDNVTIHAYASVPTYPSEPRVLRTLAGNSFVGFLLGCGLAILLGLMDRTIHDPRAITSQTGLPSLGIIPHMGRRLRLALGKNRPPARLINEFDPYSPQAESFRLVRTGLQYSTAGGSPKVIMVTSCSPSEGKSTVAANLALSFASLGESTLLIDADLKLPIAHRIFEKSRTPGLTDVLTGQQTSEDIVVSTGIEHLSLLPAGPSAPNPVELLDSAELTALLERLKDKYQRIVLDTAPLHGMSDAFVLANKADGVCLVASLGKTRSDILRRVVADMQSMKGRVLGIVFNDQTGHGLPGRKANYGLYGSSTHAYHRSGRGRYDRHHRKESEESENKAAPTET